MTFRTTRILFLIFFLLSCTQPSLHQTNSQDEHSRRRIAQDDVGFRAKSTEHFDWIDGLPKTKDYVTYLPAIQKRLTQYLRLPVSDPRVLSKAERLAKYTSFILSGCDVPSNGEEISRCTKEKIPVKFLRRLFRSSTQFVLCSDINDLSCLERFPEIPIRARYRVENPNLKLGEIKRLDTSLDQVIAQEDIFFTTQIFRPTNFVDPNQTMAARLQEKIEKDGNTAIYAALYGMDDIYTSMKGVYQALVKKIDFNVDVRAVFDEEIRDDSNAQRRANARLFPFIFTYVQPNVDLAHWIMSPFPPASATDTTVMPFEYNGGTQAIIRLLAQKAANKNDIENMKGRLEWPDNGIMHNKFFIFQNRNDFSVWTGTANVSSTCMGQERNSNMSVYIRNNDIAQAYLDEFNEMYNFAFDYDYKAPPQNSVRANMTEDVSDDDEDELELVAEDTQPVKILLDSRFPFQYGRFKSNKTPNTHRYFTLTENTATPDDDTDFRVYFSPTDDAEHRAILPMLLSARAGDIIRISMFGAAGLEYVRAMQLAASRGVKVEVILDHFTGFSRGSWVTSKEKSDTILSKENPFGTGIPIEVRKNLRDAQGIWKQNHQKVGLLLRKQPDGRYFAEHLILGSQNWSAKGNDVNDENLISIRNRSKNILIGEMFNKHFTDFLWPNAKLVNQRP